MFVLLDLTAGDGSGCVHPTAPRLQAIDALALCDVNGRMFLEMDEEDLAESDELGLDVSRGGSPLYS